VVYYEGERAGGRKCLDVLKGAVLPHFLIELNLFTFYESKIG
jgi:hypothetical protein